MKFSIRDLLWLTVVVAVVVAWRVDRRRYSEGFRRASWNYTWAAIKLDELGYVPEYKGGRIASIRPTSKQSPAALPGK